MEILDDNSKVNLFLIGAPKCGTSSYARALASSSGVFVPPEKELNFFSNKWLNVTNSYYDGVKIDSLKKYAEIFEKCDEFSYRCDASVSYFIADGCPKEIFNYNKKAKVVFISRDPIERAVSHYLMDNRLGYSSRGLSEYLNDTSSHQYLQYIENSRYSKYLSSYRWYFGENLLELTLEDGWDINKERLEKFLGIELTASMPEKNKALHYRNKYFSRLIRNRRLVHTVKKVLKNEMIKNTFRTILVSSKSSSIEVSKKEKDLIQSILRNDS
jgi:hypothetical protein